MTNRLDQSVPVDTVRQLLISVSTRLHSESEAKWIVAHASGMAVGKLLAVLDAPASIETATLAHALADRRAAGEPLQYVLGDWSFRRLEITVDQRALIPRPETEQVVEVALEELRRFQRGPGRNPTDPLVVVDLGTGSGVIALSLALEGAAAVSGPVTRSGSLPGETDIEVWATDTSSSALTLARVNLDRLAEWQRPAALRMRLAEGAWFEALPRRLAGQVHMVVSNPPYVSATEWAALDPVVRDYEPRTALVPGDSGLEAFAVLIDEARRWLVPGGRLVLEMAPHQAGPLTEMAEEAGYGDVGVRPDLTGRARALVASRPHA